MFIHFSYQLNFQLLCSLLNIIPNKSLHTDEPNVTLTMGGSLDPDAIKEGDDVYFECIITANPPVQRIYWLHNVSIYSNSSIFFCVLKKTVILVLTFFFHIYIFFFNFKY